MRELEVSLCFIAWQIDHVTTIKGFGGFGGKKVVGYENQPIRKFVACIAVEYGARSYGSKPIENSVT